LRRTTLTRIVDTAWRAVTHSGSDASHTHLSVTPLLVDGRVADAIAERLRALMHAVAENPAKMGRTPHAAGLARA
jgi:hypothetical protein